MKMDSVWLFTILLVIFIITGMQFNLASASTQVLISSGAGASANAECVTANNCFNPQVVGIYAGNSVTWTNTDSLSHTVTSGSPSDSTTGTVFDSGLIQPGNSYSFTFSNPGTYNYFCTIHPWMVGSVSVTQYTQQQSTPICNPGYTYSPSDGLCHPHTAPSLNLPSATVNGMTITINGVAQATAYGASISYIEWDWGDGQSFTGWFPQSHTYAQSGTYTIKITAYDSYGSSRWGTYSFSPRPIPSPSPPATQQQLTHLPASGYVKSDQNEYQILTSNQVQNSLNPYGVQVSITGQVYNAQPNGILAVKVLKPDGSFDNIPTSTGIGTNGWFGENYFLNQYSEIGTYQIVATWQDSSGVITLAPAFFTVTNQSTIPEFGSIVPLILVISVISIIVISAKSNRKIVY